MNFLQHPQSAFALHKTQKSSHRSDCFKAGDGTRTRDLLITNQLLCQLSYTGLCPRAHVSRARLIVYQRFICLARLFFNFLKIFLQSQ